MFADPVAFPAFKESVNKVLPFIKEATAKERAMMGNKSASGNNLAPSVSLPVVSVGSKRKRDTAEGVDESSSLKSYFFAKFLTSPDLLDLEVWHVVCPTCSSIADSATDCRHAFPPAVPLSTPDGPPTSPYSHENCETSCLKSREQTPPYFRIHSRANRSAMGPGDTAQVYRGAKTNYTKWSFVR